MLLEKTTFILILKWTGSIISAGFIAQFGKKAASALIDKITEWKKKKTDKSNDKKSKSM